MPLSLCPTAPLCRPPATEWWSGEGAQHAASAHARAAGCRGVRSMAAARDSFRIHLSLFTCVPIAAMPANGEGGRERWFHGQWRVKAGVKAFLWE